ELDDPPTLRGNSDGLLALEPVAGVCQLNVDGSAQDVLNVSLALAGIGVHREDVALLQQARSTEVFHLLLLSAREIGQDSDVQAVAAEEAHERAHLVDAARR